MSDKPFFICGPCVIETKQITLDTAKRLAEIAAKLSVKLMFKVSWAKMNRTSLTGYRGVCVEYACEVFDEVRQQANLPVTTDIHSVKDVFSVRHSVDCLQVPALLSRQTDILEAVAKYPACATIKKGPFVAPHDVRPMVEKVLAKNDKAQVAIIERGTTFGYNDNVVDYRGFKIMSDLTADLGTPIVFDCTHTVQRPSLRGDSSGGDRQLVAPLARAAAATGYCDGYFLETHPDPSKALCDGPCMVPLDAMETMLKNIIGAHQYGFEIASRNARPLW